MFCYYNSHALIPAVTDQELLQLVDGVIIDMLVRTATWQCSQHIAYKNHELWLSHIRTG